MTILYQTLVFLLPAVSMLTGLFAAPVAVILFAAIIYDNYDKFDFSRIYKGRPEMLFFAWMGLTCFWSLAGIEAFTKFIAVSAICGATILLLSSKWREGINLEKVFFVPLLLGCLLAVALFLCEYVSEGAISIYFRNIFQSPARHYFCLNFLDRGCSVLSMISWPVIYFMLKKRYFIFAALYFVLVCYVLHISDSLSSYLAFMLGGMVFFATLVLRSWASYLIIGVILFGSVLLPIFASQQSPRDLSSRHHYIPDSGKHRLFIWKYTSTKALEKPLFGWGFNSSQDMPVDEEMDVIYFNQYKWLPLPLHPHNNCIQILLECGIVGLVLFATMLVRLVLSIKNIYAKNHDLMWLSVALGCMMNYLFIGMISYGLWQMWWICLCALTLLLMNMLAFAKIAK